jgi:hypothetical protein
MLYGVDVQLRAHATILGSSRGQAVPRSDIRFLGQDSFSLQGRNLHTQCLEDILSEEYLTRHVALNRLKILYNDDVIRPEHKLKAVSRLFTAYRNESDAINRHYLRTLLVNTSQVSGGVEKMLALYETTDSLVDKGLALEVLGAHGLKALPKLFEQAERYCDQEGTPASFQACIREALTICAKRAREEDKSRFMEQLLPYLNSSNTWVNRQAWGEIISLGDSSGWEVISSNPTLMRQTLDLQGSLNPFVQERIKTLMARIRGEDDED